MHSKCYGDFFPSLYSLHIKILLRILGAINSFVSGCLKNRGGKLKCELSLVNNRLSSWSFGGSGFTLNWPQSMTSSSNPHCNKYVVCKVITVFWCHFFMPAFSLLLRTNCHIAFIYLSYFLYCIALTAVMPFPCQIQKIHKIKSRSYNKYNHSINKQMCNTHKAVTFI